MDFTLFQALHNILTLSLGSVLSNPLPAGKKKFALEAKHHILLLYKILQTQH